MIYRSKNDQWLAGVCSGIAKELGWDPLLVRLLTLFMIIAHPILFIVYILLWITLDKK